MAYTDITMKRERNGGLSAFWKLTLVIILFAGAVIPSLSSDSSDDELSEGLDSPLKL